MRSHYGRVVCVNAVEPTDRQRPHPKLNHLQLGTLMEAGRYQDSKRRQKRHKGHKHLFHIQKRGYQGNLHEDGLGLYPKPIQVFTKRTPAFGAMTKMC